MNQAQVTPQTVVEQNRSLLRSLFKFRKESKLLSYVNNKSKQEKKFYTLAEILTVLKDTIRGEKLYDEKNPSIILCSEELEQVLDMRALHVTEIRDLVLQHLIKIQDEAFLAKFRHHTNNQGSVDVPVSQTPVNTPAQRLIHTSNISTQVVTDKNAKFKVDPKFLQVLSSVPNFDKCRTIYTYEEVTLLLSTYILMNKKKFFDTRNIKLAMVQDDPLGEAFGVNAFHRCQVNNLLRGQLTPLSESPDTAVVTSSSTPGCDVSISEKPVPVTSVNGVTDTHDNLRGSAAGMALPAFPALSKAQTMPGQCTGFVRKRSDSETDTEDNKATKLARTHRSKSVSDCETCNDTDTETETIESVQSKETIEANNANDNVSEEDDVQEYEPETGDEAERPPQAMGRSGAVSDFSDSGTDLDVDIIIDNDDVKRRRDEAKKDSVYWGDSEIDEKELSSYDSELEPADIWTCHTCNKPNKPYFRYCLSCWKVRRGWLGYDGRKKKKSKKSRRNITSHDSDNETDGGTVEDRPRMDSQDSGIGTGDSQEFEIAQNSQKKVLERSVSQLSTKSTESSSSSGYHSIQSKTSHLCLLCCTRPKDASLVHGRIGHQVCCYTCAKKLWRKRADCPVCRRKVERIIKIIPA